MNKSMKPSANAQMSEEQKREQLMRAFLQKKAFLAEGILFNLCQSCGRDLCYDLDNKMTNDNHLKIVKIADEMSTEFMKVIYNQELTEEDTQETE